MQTLLRNVLLGGGGGYSPASLFAGGVEGALYDPSDLSTLYQDSAGTTPVTGVEQVVGLMLDKSKNLALGPELVTNGDFNTNLTGWSNGVNMPAAGTAVWNAGALRLTRTSNTVSYQQAITTVVGKWYFVSGLVTFVSGTGEGAIFKTDSASSIVVNAVSGGPSAGQSGIASFYFCATATTTYIHCVTGTTNNTVYDFDVVTVKELTGNHATSTGSARPTLSARVNLLTYSEQFQNAVWSVKTNLTFTTGVIDPNGGLTAMTITATGGAGRLLQPISTSAGNYNSSIWIRRRTGSGTITWEAPQVGVGPLINVTSQWQRFSVIGVLSTTTYYYGIRIDTVGDAIDIAFSDLRPTNIGVNIPSYQRIAAATNYDTNGFPFYLSFGGAQSMSTPANLNLTSTDKVTVYAGVRKLSDAFSIITELSSQGDVNNGAFLLYTNTPASSGFASRGTVASYAQGTTTAAPFTMVNTGLGDIAGDNATLRINGAQVAQSTADQGTGNYGTYPFYIGARAGSSLFFTGYLYSLIIQGAAASATQLASTEAWVNQKTKAY